MSAIEQQRGAEPSGPPPGSWAPLFSIGERLTRPLRRLLAFEATSGLLLIAAAVAALLWANSSASSSYGSIWHSELGVRLGTFSFARSLEWFVNDVLMAIFFFVVGLEIRKELHDGQLSEWRRAVLPVVAALGGMVVPASIYLGLAGAGETRAGWGIPMATDIAFALGVLILLGKRVPAALRVLLLAVAVIDDLGAILVIALFYSSGIAVSGLLLAALGVLLILGLGALGVRRMPIYVAPAVLVWAGVYAAGVHPTIAGVIVGLLTPVRAWQGVESEAPADFLLHALHPWVSYVIMPIFALANSGVTLSGVSLSPGAPLRAGSAVILALLLGKPVGVVAASAFALRTKLAVLPAGLTRRHVLVLGVVAGIGFTMSLFLAQLAFGEEETLLGAAKLGVLVGSGLALTIGLVLGRLVLPEPARRLKLGAAQNSSVGSELDRQ
ncbi:MAG TPA: Na+/H+ antiporter NhaA [Polyangiaceae bacterium]|nr:Na+/H+ antiporter NhaA [Polyangiaceae bacterium]